MNHTNMSGYDIPLEGTLPVKWVKKLLINLDSTTFPIGSDIDIQLSKNSITISEYYRLLELISTRLNVSELGVRMVLASGPMDYREFGILGYLMASAPTLKDALLTFNQYQTLFAPNYCAHFEFHENTVHFSFSETLSQGDKIPCHDIALAMGVMVKLIQRVVGSNWWPMACSFKYALPTKITDHKQLFGDQLFFSAPQNEFHFEAKILNNKMPNGDVILHSLLRQQADEMLRVQQPDEHLPHHLRIIISSQLNEGGADIKRVASELGMSDSSLRRKLQKSGLSFRALREQVIMDLAKSHLLTSQKSITDISYSLGFSDAGSFSLLFRRYQGCSPRIFRMNNPTT